MLNLREPSVKYKSHYIPFSLLLCWFLGLWGVLCIAIRYDVEELISRERAANISECTSGISKDGQSNRSQECNVGQRFWESHPIFQVFVRISEVCSFLYIIALIVCTQRYVEQELDTAMRLVHKMLKPFANEQATTFTSETYYNATHSDAGMDNERMRERQRDYTDSPNPTKQTNNSFDGENERCNAGGDFHFTPGKIISEMHEMHCYYELPSCSEDAPEFCGLKLRRFKMESHTYSEMPCSFENDSVLKPRFITASPEFQEFLVNMREFTRESYTH